MEYRWLFLDVLKAALAGKPYVPEGEISPEIWEQVMALSREHQVLPMVFQAVHAQDGFRNTPLQGAIRQRVYRDVFLQTRKTEEFLQLYRNLREAGVHPLVVKGIICRNLYPEPDQRPSSDEDVLIAAEEFGVCHEVLTAFGMETGEDPARFEKRYEIPYRRKGSPLYIELHKSLFPVEHDVYSGLNAFFAGAHDRAAEEIIGGERILTLCPTDHLFYLICHAFKHFLHGGFGIRQACDIVLFARNYGNGIDWMQVLENCRKIRADKFTAALFAIGEKHLGLKAEVPEIWQMHVDETALLEDLLSSGVYGTADMERKHSSNITLNAMARQNRGKATGSGVIRSLFPGAASLEGRYPYLKKHPWLLPVAWASRIFRFAVRGGSNGAAKAMQIGKERIGLMKQYGILDE